MMDTRKKKKYGHRAIVSLLAALLAVSIVPNATKYFEVAHAAEAYKAVHRLYNPNSGDHHYTTEVSEKVFLENVGWNYEGIGWFAAAQSESPVYRLYNPNAYCFNHHYTMDKNEREFLLNVGWKNEGIGWYSCNDSGRIPVFRVYNPNSGEHHYTKDEKEKNYLVSLGWNDEGVAWYGFPASTDNGGTSGGSTGGNTEPTESTRDLYAYKTTKYMSETPGCTGKAPIKSDYSNWTTSGLKPVPYDYVLYNGLITQTNYYAKYFGELSQYTGYWGPGPKSSMYYGAVNAPNDGSFKTMSEWLDYYKAQNDPVKYWGEGALTAEDVFSWYADLKNSGQKPTYVTAAEFPISEEYVYRRMQARITEHDDESPYAADGKDTPTSFDDVFKPWGGDKWYYEPGLKSGACAAYAADIQDYAFGYAYNRLDYKNVTIDEIEKTYGTDIYDDVNGCKLVKTDIIKKCMVPIRVGDIIRYPNHSSLVTKVYEQNGRIYYDTADGNAAGMTSTNERRDVSGILQRSDLTIYTRWTESAGQYGDLIPLGVNDIEYYANGTHQVSVVKVR